MASNLGQAYGTQSTLTCSLNTLTNTSSRQSNALTNTNQVATGIGFRDVQILVKIKTGTGTSSTGTVNIYVAGSIDGGTTYNGGASGSDGSYTVNGNEIPLGVIYANADATVYEGLFSVRLAIGAVPQNMSVIITNNSGASLDGSAGGTIQYQGIYDVSS